MKPTSTLAFLLLFSVSGFTQQLLVNQIVLDTFAAPLKQYSYSKLANMANGGYALMFNTYYTGVNQSSTFVIGVDSTSSIYGAVEFNPTSAGANVGTNLYSKDTFLYMIGSVIDSTGNSISCNMLKININTFDTVWSISRSLDSTALSQAPFAVVADNYGYVYLGISVKTATQTKIEVFKLDSSANTVWVATFDTAGMYSIPVAMTVGTSFVGVTGLVSDGLGNTDFATYTISRTTGYQYAAKYEPSGTGFISHPTAGIVADASGDIYVAGTSTVGANASVIKLVEYDSAMNLIFETTWGDSTLVSTVSRFYSPVPGYLFMIGTTTNSAGIASQVLLYYGPDGTLYGSITLPNPNPAYSAGGTDMAIDNSGDMYITGWAASSGTDTSAYTAEYDPNMNLMWAKTYHRAPGTTDMASSIITISGYSTPFVSVNSYGADSMYLLLEYDQYTKTNTLTTTTSGGQYEANQLIIRFDPSAVNQDAVNNTDMVFAPPSYWLTPEADSALQSVAPFYLDGCVMERIYKGLKTTYKYSIARNGDSVPIPDLWAGFLLIHPPLEEGDENTTAAAFNSLFPMVVHTGLNYVGQFLGCNATDPHPVSCRVNDPYFPNGFTINNDAAGQQDLWNDSVSSGYTCDNNYNINIDSAWALETGKPFIKVGIYDSGLDGLNADFCPYSAGTQSGKATGWDFYNNVSLPQESWVNADAPSFAHGTMISGIIGAIRNNGIGIAGIAGGNWSPTDTSNYGATLYSMKISHDTTYAAVGGGSGTTVYGLITLPVSDICNALTIGCTYTGYGYGYGLHVINNSWGIVTDSTAAANLIQTRSYSDAELSEIEYAFKNVYRNQTASIAAAGNTAAWSVYPANFYNDWIICVGGATDTGGYYSCGCNGSTTTYLESYVGSCVDMVAPSLSDPANNSGYVINTTDWSGQHFPFLGITSTFDAAYGGTSMSAPHATGTVALLMSYLDSTASVYKNLSPEDAEHLLTRSADNMGYVGHSDSTGWGNLNTGRSLQSVNKACNKLVHLGKTGNNASSILIKAYTPITLTERYTNPLTGVTYDTITYLCWVYKESSAVSQSLDSGFTIVDSWTRPSSTTLLLAYDSVSHTLQPFEHLYIDSMSTASATISGYYYVLYLPSDSFNPVGYWGTDSAGLLSQDSFRFDYTLLLNNPSASCHPVDSTTRIRQLENQMQISFFPNPVEDAGLLQISTDVNTNVSVDVFDMQGREMQSVYSGPLYNGGTSFNINTKLLTSGVYMIVVNSGEGKKTIKFTKL